MAKTRQLTFHVYLTDAARVAELQALHPNGYLPAGGPLGAATEFSAPYAETWIPTLPPKTMNEWYPQSGADKYPIDRTYFTLNNGGFWGFFGASTKYVWVGQFVYAPPLDLESVDNPGVPAGQMLTVAFMDGFEFPPISTSTGPEGSESSTNIRYSRDASRTPDGFGLALRNDGGVEVRHDWGALGATATTRGWERFYLRIRAYGGSDTVIWRSRAGGGNGGMALIINSSGGLVLRKVNTSGTLQGGAIMSSTTTLAVSVDFTCVDIVQEQTAGHYSIRLYLNHILEAQVVDYDHAEGGVARVLASSTIGGGTLGLVSSGLEVDVDDWVGFIPPASVVPGANDIWQQGTVYPGADWTHGHHVAAVAPFAFDATHAGWTGNVRGLAQRYGAQAEAVLASSTSSALLAADTNAHLQAAAAGSLGAQAVLVFINSRRSGLLSGQLGFSFKETGAAVVTTMAAVSQAGTYGHNFVAYRPARTAPMLVESLMLRFTKSADTDAQDVKQLGATMLLVGTFGPEDLTAVDDGAGGELAIAAPGRPGIHNAPYPRSPWNGSQVPPDSPMWVKAGTYTGNALGQDVILKIPGHFWWVRQAPGTAGGGVHWFSSANGPTWALDGGIHSAAADALEDPTYSSPGGDLDPESRSIVRVAGSDTAENAAAVVYEYVVFGDPGSRFMLNGAFTHAADAATRDNVLVDSTFTPEAAFFLLQYNALVANALAYKGPGHAAGYGQFLNLTEGATIADFAAGLITSRASLHGSTVDAVLYSAWRNADGADYTGFELDEPVPVQIFSYIGDGAASRTLAFPRLTGNRPLWALVAPHDGGSYVRDPAHLTNTSSQATQGSGTVTTGITGGGLDQMSVGSSLNTNGTIYDVFVIMGTPTAGNGGWGANGEVFYEPIPVPGDQWPPGLDQDDIDDGENGGGGAVDSFDDGPDLADDLADPLCVPFTQRAVNLALARIGVSDRMTAATDLTAPTSREFTLVAEFYEHTLRFVLRDFPWPHATRYATLTRIGGNISDPVNGDWLYSFRAPSGCLMVRRVIRPGLGRKHDPRPPHYRMAVDDVGPLVYIGDDGVQFDRENDNEPFVEIEYTVRPPCGAKAGGDQKFISAFAYRLAFELSTPLSRDDKTAARMERGYWLEKNTAATTAQNEQQQEPGGDPDWIRGR